MKLGQEIEISSKGKRRKLVVAGLGLAFLVGFLGSFLANVAFDKLQKKQKQLGFYRL